MFKIAALRWVQTTGSQPVVHGPQVVHETLRSGLQGLRRKRLPLIIPSISRASTLPCSTREGREQTTSSCSWQQIFSKSIITTAFLCAGGCGSCMWSMTILIFASVIRRFLEVGNHWSRHKELHMLPSVVRCTSCFVQTVPVPSSQKPSGKALGLAPKGIHWHCPSSSALWMLILQLPRH